MQKCWIAGLALALIAAFARFIYSGWYSPLFVLPMRGDGVRCIFSGVNGYFLPGILRSQQGVYFNFPYISTMFFYSIFHPLCLTRFLNIALIAVTHISAISIIFLSMGMFEAPAKKKLFLLLMIVAVFNWAPFYDGVLQGFPPEFAEVLLITIGFSLLLAGYEAFAGIAFGFAGLLKILPVVFLAYFIYKKKYRLVIAALITCVIFSIIILCRENMSWNLLTSISGSMGGRETESYGYNNKDAGLSSFIYFVFHRCLRPPLLVNIHFAVCILLVLFFILVERRILSERDKYLFSFAAVSLAMFHVSPHCSEMYWYILILPAIIFNIWMLLTYRDKLFTGIFVMSYIFLHGFSLLNILFRAFKFVDKGSDLYLSFNVHGGVFIGIWLLFFSTYGLVLKHLIPDKKAE
jgi:hypothetical protein